MQPFSCGGWESLFDLLARICQLLSVPQEGFCVFTFLVQTAKLDEVALDSKLQRTINIQANNKIQTTQNQHQEIKKNFF